MGLAWWCHSINIKRQIMYSRRRLNKTGTGETLWLLFFFFFQNGNFFSHNTTHIQVTVNTRQQGRDADIEKSSPRWIFVWTSAVSATSLGTTLLRLGRIKSLTKALRNQIPARFAVSVCGKKSLKKMVSNKLKNLKFLSNRSVPHHFNPASLTHLKIMSKRLDEFIRWREHIKLDLFLRQWRHGISVFHNALHGILSIWPWSL